MSLDVDSSTSKIEKIWYDGIIWNNIKENWEDPEFQEEMESLQEDIDWLFSYGEKGFFRALLNSDYEKVNEILNEWQAYRMEKIRHNQ
ncbi:MAG: hypothetical protein H0Z32_14940 [Bacillaceae bacterium]|nr:hypothetical protein [Bacillaceae bacterium]